MPIIRRRSVIQACPGMWVAAAGGGGSPAWVNTASAYQSVGYVGNTATFTSQAIGTAASDRYVIVGVGTSDGAVVTGVTVGGNSATKIHETVDSGSLNASLWMVNVTTGTTANIVVTSSASINKVGIVAGAATGISSTAPSGGAIGLSNNAFDSNPRTATVTIPSGGFAVCAGATVTDNDVTASNSTLDYTQDSGGAAFGVFMTSNTSSSGSQAIGANMSPEFTGACLVVAAFGA
jgi:hypothetical protein